MKIVLIGAGKVGYTLAQRLSEDDHDVIVIEHNAERIETLRKYLEVLVVEGNGANPDLLASVGMKDAELFIAVTDADEVNLLACYVAKKLGATQTIARVRSNEYINGKRTDVLTDLGLTLVINPEMVTAHEILQILKTPNVLDVESFANGKARLIEIKAQDNQSLLNRKIRDLDIPDKILVVGILRHGRMIIPNGDDSILPLDNIFFLGASASIQEIETNLTTQNRTHETQNILLVGAGLIGRNLAVLLENENYHVKVIDKDLERCERLAEIVEKTIVIHGDGTDVDLLRSEEIEDSDVIVCLTDDDKLNLLVALMAKHFGVAKAFVRVGRPEYIPLMEQVGVDVVFSPRLVTSTEILRQIRKGELLTVSSFENSKAEALELELSIKNPLVGRMLSQVNIPGSSLLGAVVRGEETIVPNGATVCQEGDRIVIFTLPEDRDAVLEFMKG